MKNDSVKTLDAIRRLTLKDLDAISDQELCAEIVSDGGDPEAVARSVAMELDAVVAAAMRKRAAAAKERVVVAPVMARHRPALVRIKELIDNAFRVDPGLATAFQAGTRQTEIDLQSLYDDLVDLGKIDPDFDD